MSKELAKAIKETLSSPNVEDSNGEAANVVDVLDKAAKALWCLSRRTKKGAGESALSLGAIELVAFEHRAGLESIASAIRDGLHEIAEVVKVR